MLWLITAISGYFFLAVVALGDKYLLEGLLKPKTYAFYSGVLGIAVLALIPFVGFSFPDFFQFGLSFLAGFIFIFAILSFFEGLNKYEASRIVPAIGGFLPIFTFILSYFFFGKTDLFDLNNLLAFIFLLSGTFFITKSSSVKISLDSLKISFVSSFLFALYFVLTKYIFINYQFWSGLIVIRMAAVIVSLFLIFSKDVRQEIFKIRSITNKKTGLFFILNQSLAAAGFFLQNLAIAIAGASYLAIINALEGIKYVFVFVFTLFLFKKFPDILKEEITRKVIIQKAVAIFLIGAGLLTLVF